MRDFIVPDDDSDSEALSKPRMRTRGRKARRGAPAELPPAEQPRTQYPKSVQVIIQREEEALAAMSDQGSEEAAKIRLYLQWLKSLPWCRSPAIQVDLGELRRCLDEDHEGLPDVKQRILEEMALLNRTGKPQRTILCLVGPPGVGKTSIAKSIARARDKQLAKAHPETHGKQYQHCAAGGLTQESELRGHHRAYVGATPGRIIRGMRDAGCSNPVFVIDEIDKLGTDNGMNQVAGALLEVLDPEQNCAFTDHFIDHPIDLSDVLFVLTANSLDSMHPALRDRCEIIHLSAYSNEEKIQIATNHLIPKAMGEAHLQTLGITWDEAAIRKVINDYTWEPGVRKLRQLVGSICRKLAFADAQGQTVPHVTEQLVSTYLGTPNVMPDRVYTAPGVGRVHGLYASDGGGGILRVVAQPHSKRGLELTGNLSKSVRESIKIGFTYLTKPGAPCHEQSKLHGLHVSISDGGTKKDGPSAGIAALACMASAYLGIPVNHSVVLTGELELDGHVGPVGGVPEKLAGAFRSGIRRAIIPKANMADLDKLREYTNRGLVVTPVETGEEVLQQVLLVSSAPPTPRQEQHA